MRKDSRIHVLLQVMVQILIWGDFRGIWRGIDYLNVTLVIIQPFLDNFSVMNPQVINDKQDFPIRVLHELSHEINETLLGHVFLILMMSKKMAAAAYERGGVIVNSCCLGWRRTATGNWNADTSPEDGAGSVIAALFLDREDPPYGYHWRYGDRIPLDEHPDYFVEKYKAENSVPPQWSISRVGGKTLLKERLCQ